MVLTTFGHTWLYNLFAQFSLYGVDQKMSGDKPQQQQRQYASNEPTAADQGIFMSVGGFGAKFVNKQQIHSKPPQHQSSEPPQIHEFMRINNPAKNNQMIHHHDSVESSSIEDIGDLDFGGLDSSSSIYTNSPSSCSQQQQNSYQQSKHPPTPQHGSATSSAINIHHYTTDTVESTVNEVQPKYSLLSFHPAVFASRAVSATKRFRFR